MAKFCTKCGRPLVDGQPCSCVAPQQNAPAANNTITIRTLIAKLKNQIGLGDPIMNETDAFENDKKIVPDCIKANDSEIPVKQYRIATLRNRLCGIPYAKAIGIRGRPVYGMLSVLLSLGLIAQCEEKIGRSRAYVAIL